MRHKAASCRARRRSSSSSRCWSCRRGSACWLARDATARTRNSRTSAGWRTRYLRVARCDREPSRCDAGEAPAGRARARDLDRLAAEARGDVALKRELADAYQKIAQVQNSGLGANLGRHADRPRELRQGADNPCKALAARTPVESQDVFGLALLEFDLGTCGTSRRAGRARRAVVCLGGSPFEELSATGALHNGERIRLAGIYEQFRAEAQAFQGKSDAAIRSAEKAVAAADAALRAKPQDRAARSVLAAASYRLFESFAGRDRYREAIRVDRASPHGARSGPPREPARVAGDAHPSLRLEWRRPLSRANG